MRLQIEFNNQSCSPMCAINLNDIELYRGPVNDSYDFIVDVLEGDCKLVIEHWGKDPNDTIVENGVIVKDKSFELKKIVIDGYDIEELIWHSEFNDVNGNTYKSCLFFGPNGNFVLNFYNPVVYWMLKTRHEKSGNDPHWEEDFNYWDKACKILTQISSR